MRTLDVVAPLEQTEGTRARVLRWLKDEGESIEENEPLLELETDKVTLEVAAPGSGVLHEILATADEEVEPGALLGRIRSEARRERLSPAVRRLLAEHRLDAASIRGTGADGRITADDVLAAAAASAGRTASLAATASGTAAIAPAAAAAAAAPVVPAPPSGFIPHTPMRKCIAERMVASLLHTAPHVTTVFEADLGRVLEHRAARRASAGEQGADPGARLTLTAYFVVATAVAARAVPEANARWTESGLELNDSVDIGIATALGEQGLVVPVLRGAHSLDVDAIATRIEALTRRARERRLAADELNGGTITISNHGVSGSLLAAPIVIQQPQSAIVGVGKVEYRPVVIERDGRHEIVARPRCYATLTVDHRVMDGHRANAFMAAWVAVLEQWPAG